MYIRPYGSQPKKTSLTCLSPSDIWIFDFIETNKLSSGPETTEFWNSWPDQHDIEKIQISLLCLMNIFLCGDDNALCENWNNAIEYIVTEIEIKINSFFIKSCSNETFVVDGLVPNSRITKMVKWFCFWNLACYTENI